MSALGSSTWCRVFIKFLCMRIAVIFSWLSFPRVNTYSPVYPQGLVCSTDHFNLLTDPSIRNEEGYFKKIDDILTSANDVRQLEARLKKLLTI